MQSLIIKKVEENTMAKKNKIVITNDGRRKADVIIGKGGNITFTKDTVVLIDDENVDAGSEKIVELLKVRIKMGSKKDDFIEE